MKRNVLIKIGEMMLNVNYSRRSGSLPVKELLWISLLMLAITWSQAKDNNCCSDGLMWLHTLNCSDGNAINLACSFGWYIVNPEMRTFDNFTIIEEYGKPWLQFVDTVSTKIEAESFCVARNPNTGVKIALVCTDIEYDGIQWRNTLFCTLSIISAIFLIITLAVYVLLPELREIQDKAMMAVVTSLTVSYIILSIQMLRQQHDDDYHICVSLGFILYFGFMAVFFWLNIVSFNIWRIVWFKDFMIGDKMLFTIYSIIGWSGPLCLLIAILITHHVEGNHLKPGFGESSCWFNGHEQTWAYFYGPISILLTLNVIYLGLTGWRLWHQYRDYSGSKLRVLRFKCLLYVKLILFMGVTWIFEVLSYADHSKQDFWIPMDILNALQGFIIFLLLVGTRKRVRKLLAKKRPCGIGFPKSWAAYEDEECEEVLPEEVELSQHD
ncbi:probable G-protein coupled receptor Mth-like 1 isoform X1 [Bombus fervidus]|uniref:probable G-protein coupled receptor Mth-like 1 isoform X1 n=1 Tax=Bombus fervidus TaxID=203811 RepID=UPI003AB3EABC